MKMGAEWPTLDLPMLGGPRTTLADNRTLPYLVPWWDCYDRETDSSRSRPKDTASYIIEFFANPALVAVLFCNHSLPKYTDDE